MQMKKCVLVVDDWDGWQGPVPILALNTDDAEVVIVKTVEEAAPFFNGEAKAGVLIVSEVEGISDFVKEVRRRFGKLLIIGLAEHMMPLSNLGCNCFVPRDNLPASTRAFLNR